MNFTGFANTGVGINALRDNVGGTNNVAVGANALLKNKSFQNVSIGNNSLVNNDTGSENTAVGTTALSSNTTGTKNTAIGRNADVSAGNLTNATAIGNGAVVNASNKVRIGNTAVTVIEGQVAFTASSDRNVKENFLPVDGAAVLKKIQGIPMTSWNYKGHDPKQFRHYGPMAQDFFAAFGKDAHGTIGTPTTINSGDMAGILMTAVKELANRNEKLSSENTALKQRLTELEARDKEREARLANLERIALEWHAAK
jgi:carbonic anhydrase/acetyltransferase-like protein (isoleucine patch superfamily)